MTRSYESRTEEVTQGQKRRDLVTKGQIGTEKLTQGQTRYYDVT